jgi:predicted ATPase
MSGNLSVVIGRDREVAAAEAFLDQVTAGPSCLVIEGEPGIGKTTIWRAVLDGASKRGHRVLSCVGDQAETRLSLAGLGDLLVEVSAEELAELPAPQRFALERAPLRRGRAETGALNARTIGR